MDKGAGMIRGPPFSNDSGALGMRVDGCTDLSGKSPIRADLRRGQELQFYQCGWVSTNDTIIALANGAGVLGSTRD